MALSTALKSDQSQKEHVISPLINSKEDNVLSHNALPSLFESDHAEKLISLLSNYIDHDRLSAKVTLSSLSRIVRRTLLSYVYAASLPSPIPIWDPNAQTFINSCQEAHFNSVSSISITNLSIHGIYVCFPDQMNTYNQVIAGNFDNQALTLEVTGGCFYNRFTGIQSAYEVRSAPNQVIMMDNSFASYDTVNQNAVISEITSKVKPVNYDGRAYPIYSCFLMPDRSSIPSVEYGFMGAVGERLGSTTSGYGFTCMMRDVLDMLTWGDSLNAGMIYTHEVGHSLGLQHNYNNLASIMFPTSDPKVLRLLDRSDIQNICSHLAFLPYVLGPAN